MSRQPTQLELTLSSASPLGVAIVRMGIATSVLLTLWKLSGWEDMPVGLYRPVGLWMLAGHRVPGDAVLTVLWVVAVASTVAMLVGAWTRVATVVSLVSALLLASYAVSFSETWSHQYNVVFLAQLAFVRARAGDVGSVDAWWRKQRGRPPAIVPGGYGWSLWLCQFAVGLMFLSAFVFKIGAARGTLDWALSDNLRHQLLARFDLIGVPRTAVADWLLASEWRWKAAALGNLVSQAMPIAACFAWRRPPLRLVFGSFFVMETLALGVVMDLWNLHWLPLAVVFVDWDWVAARLGRRAGAAAAGGARLPRAVRYFVAAFVTYDVLVSFMYPRIDQRLNTYPFSAFPMFSVVRARRPYDRHQSYDLAGGLVEVLSDRPVDEKLRTWIDQAYRYRTMWKLRTPALLRQRMTVLLGEIVERGASLGVRGVRLHLAVFRAPAVPAAARLDRTTIAVIAELDMDGRWRTVLGEVGKDARGTYAELRPVGVDARDVRLVAFGEEDMVTPVPLVTVERVGDRVYYEPPASSGGGSRKYQVAAIVTAADGGEETFLVGGR